MVVNKNFSRALKYLKAYIPLSILTLFLGFLSSVVNAAPAWLVKYIIDDVLTGNDYKLLLICSALILLSFLIKGITSYYQEVTSEIISSSIVYDLQKNTYDKLLMLSYEFFSKSEVGDLLSRFSNDIKKFKALLMSVFNLTIKVTTILVLLWTIFYYNWKLAFISIIFIPVLTLIVRKYTQKVYKTGSRIQKVTGEITSYLQESFQGIREIKAFAMEVFESKRFDKVNRNNYKASIKNRKAAAKVTPVIDFFNAFSVVFILIIGGNQVINGEITSGEFLSFITALMLISDPLRNLTKLLNKVSENLSAVERVFEILDKNIGIEESNNVIELDNIKGEVEFKNVYFKYEKEQEYVVENVSVSADLGEVVAIVGQSGSGKTTLVNLIPRFYDTIKGDILIDGVKIKEMSIKQLRKNVGIVPQNTFLFNETIKYNIGYGNSEASETEIIEAAKMANAYEFIIQLNNGFDTTIGENGIFLSGGQKQRISIARAILKNPKILILDEATSALDTESERLVQSALEKLMENRTTFVIAHRLSTVVNADKIIVMKNGKIIERGSHQELLLKNGAYKELYDKQFGD